MTDLTLEDFFSVENPTVDPLWTDLAEMIKAKYNTTPRNLQKALGPSQVGHPCMRKLAYGMMQAPRSNPPYDPLPSVVGTAMHTWLEDAARMDNERLERERWLIETRVEVTPGLTGSADLFDTDSGTVIDWKNLGTTTFPVKVKNPGTTYKAQIHMYGRGFKRMGYDVRRVCIAILPRAGTLRKMHLFLEDYDDDFVDSVLARRDAVIAMLNDFDVETDPARYKWFPTSPDTCIFCEWWRPEPKTPYECDGRAT